MMGVHKDGGDPDGVSKILLPKDVISVSCAAAIRKAVETYDKTGEFPTHYNTDGTWQYESGQISFDSFLRHEDPSGTPKYEYPEKKL